MGIERVEYVKNGPAILKQKFEVFKKDTEVKVHKICDDGSIEIQGNTDKVYTVDKDVLSEILEPYYKKGQKVHVWQYETTAKEDYVTIQVQSGESFNKVS